LLGLDNQIFNGLLLR